MKSVAELAGTFWISALVLILAGSGKTHAEDDPRLADVLRPVIAAHDGVVAVAVQHLSTSASFAHRAEEPMPTASLIKLPIMIAAYHQAESGKLDLEQSLELKEADKVPGSGILTSHFSSGTRISLRDAIRLMTVYSDNTATNLVVDQLGLPVTSDLMSGWNLSNTRLHSKIYRGDTSIAPDRSAKFGLGSTTAAEMLQLLVKLDRRELVSADASKQMLDHLSACEDKARFGRFLPKGMPIAIKTGSVGGTRTAAGVIESPSGHIAICVLTSNNVDQSWTDDNAGVWLCAEIARRAFEHFNPPKIPTTDQAPQDLKEGASGELVEALQRTLNKRTAGTRLSVDGDFGPVTRQAVVAFQQAQSLNPTGAIDTETWKALGPLILKDEDGTAEPDLINKEIAPTKPADSIDGPPIVSSRAWVIADAATGRPLWQDKGNERREIASMTKVMTAWVVLQLAAEDSKLLDEVITFSSDADKTPGSTCGLKKGEKVSVGELLYGLMLPSGNDAATALAEFAGPRCATEDGSADVQSPIARFVVQMNRTAETLGMNETVYANPHGLPDTRSRSTAIDQAILASRAMQNSQFRNYVQTRKHAVRVEGPGGYSRNVVWKNSNELLEIAGYFGVKTGTTDAAGACLVSLGMHQNEELIVVVLGSASNQSRYVDSRNLFRWAWRKRGHSD